MVANLYQANKALADATVTKAKDITSNTYILGHSLLTRMTVTAICKDMKQNNTGVTTVPLLFTFAS